jgi:hypothetical protein
VVGVLLYAVITEYSDWLIDDEQNFIGSRFWRLESSKIKVPAGFVFGKGWSVLPRWSLGCCNLWKGGTLPLTGQKSKKRPRKREKTEVPFFNIKNPLL